MRNLVLLIVIILAVSCTENKHFISNKNYRNEVEKDFLEVKEFASNRAPELFGVFNQDLSGQNILRKPDNVICGSERLDTYLDLLNGLNVGIVANQSSLVGNTHLLDTLLSRGIRVEKVFSPEHGFRGNAQAGIKVDDGVDPVSGLKVISLYGSKRKPAKDDLKGLDVILFDIQDIGVRFYTYVSTMHSVMEACNE